MPEDISGLKQLHTLSLSNNQLESLPEDIGELTQLEELDLSDNKLTSLPASIENLKDSLTSLNLTKNPIMETCIDGKNLGRRELQRIFGDRVRF